MKHLFIRCESSDSFQKQLTLCLEEIMTQGGKLISSSHSHCFLPNEIHGEKIYNPIYTAVLIFE